MIFVILTFPHFKLTDSYELTEFVISFYNKYHYKPDLKYSLAGYEIGMYFLEILSENGAVFPYIFSQTPTKLLESIYDFKQDYEWSGFKNQGMMILQYNDFGYQRLY